MKCEHAALPSFREKMSRWGDQEAAKGTSSDHTDRPILGGVFKDQGVVSSEK